MELYKAIETRYSCRHFSEQPVAKEELIKLISAAHRAPSACNSQRWLFIIVDDAEKKTAIADTMYHEQWKINHYAHNIPAFIVAVKHPVRNPSDMQKDLLSPNLRRWSDFDLGLAVENICLTATALSLGSVIMGWYDEDKIKSLLEVPEALEIPAIIGIGYPENPDKARSTPRVPIEKVLRFNSFSNEE